MRVTLAAAACVLLLAVPSFCIAQPQQTQSAAPPQQAPAPQQTPPDSDKALRVGGNVMQAKLIHMVPPVYPEIAKMAHVSGSVVLHAIIATDGSVQEISVISGPLLLRQAAIDAVSQWKYQTTLLNGRAVKVDTTVTVVFDLAVSPTPDATGGVPDTETPKPIDPQLKANILKLLDLTHAIAMGQNMAKLMMQQLRPTLLASLPPTPHRDQIVDAYGNKLTAALASQEILDQLALIYAKYFSSDDISALIQFYQSPLGQRSLSVMPQIAAESSQVGANAARQNIPRILQELCKEYPELQGKVQFCPAASQTKSGALLGRELRPSAISLSAVGANP